MGSFLDKSDMAIHKIIEGGPNNTLLNSRSL